MPNAADESGLTETTRVEAFSDGVFAIALTLLVLDLHTPANARGNFAKALAEQWPAYVAYLAAFLNVASIWINHHDLFTRVRLVDARLVAANLVLLLVSSLFPWPAAIVSEALREGTRGDQITACLVYAGIGVLVPLSWLLVYGYLNAKPQLLRDPGETAYLRHTMRFATISATIFVIAGLSAFAQPLIALIAFVVVPIFFILVPLVPRNASAASP